MRTIFRVNINCLDNLIVIRFVQVRSYVIFQEFFLYLLVDPRYETVQHMDDDGRKM